MPVLFLFLISEALRQPNTISPYVPDLYRFSSPRQPRSLVTWRQWNGGPFGRVQGPAKEQLVPIADGTPYHLGMSRGLVPRINYFNTDDFATTTAWNTNQATKPDTGFAYGWTLLNPRQQSELPRYLDVYRI